MGGSSWRDTLYVWDGILEVKDPLPGTKESSLNWDGVWVGCENCADAKKADAPKRVGAARDVDSANHFSINGKANPIGGDEGSITDSTAYPHEASLVGGEGWDMGEGSEKKKYLDESHNVLLSNLRWKGNMRDQRDNLVFAKGRNDFGDFVSAGWMRPGSRITLARRYLEEDDARIKWSLEDLQKAVLNGIYDEQSGQVHVPPWQCDALHAEFQQEGKRKQGED